MSHGIEPLKDLSQPVVLDECYQLGMDGIFIPKGHVDHRNDEYDEAGFDVLLRMQAQHFWYRGRHKFLLAAVRRSLLQQNLERIAACDLGGGCGGWLQYVKQYAPNLFDDVALADSSLKALQYARSVTSVEGRRYQIDLMQLHWCERWDVTFLLDVLEHLPDHSAALQQIHAALKPGGLLFVTTPALRFFWSYNDDIAHHQRRYSKADFRRLAKESGFKLIDVRYFMFFLSPLLLLTRAGRTAQKLSDAEAQALMARTHRVPSWPINKALGAIFAAETPLGHWLPFPWGTSILGVFQKPKNGENARRVPAGD